MADNLVDEEWWNKEGSSEEPKKKVGGMKRKAAVGKKSIKSTSSAGDASKNRRKRKRITEAKLPNVGADGEDFRKLIMTGAESSLQFPDDCVSVCNVDMNHTVGSFLKTGIPKWKKVVSEHKHKMSPLILVLCGNALRACNFNSEAKTYKGEDCKSQKLFAKHMKMKPQAAKLKENICHFAVGTPSRVLALLDEGHLSLEFTKFVVLDWNWRDVKLKRMVDMADIRTPLVSLFQKHVFPGITEHGRPKIGLY